jgi:hypothetical protein
VQTGFIGKNKEQTIHYQKVTQSLHGLEERITGTYLERDGDNLLMIYVSVNPDI